MGFHDLIEKSGKGLDESRDIYTLFEMNLGGTVGTVYFADANLTIDGTYYDGKISHVSAVNRFLHPDKGSYEVSKLGVSLFNHGKEFYTGHWVHKNLIGCPAELKLRVGTISSTEYGGAIKDFGYDCDNDLFHISVEDYTRTMWDKQIPPKVINKDDIPGDPISMGTPLPWIYGLFRPSQTGSESPPFYRHTWGVPALHAGTYAQGTMEFLVAGHPMGTINEFYVDGTKMSGTAWDPTLSGTFHSLLGGTGNVCYLTTQRNVSGTGLTYVTGWGITHNNALDGTYLRRFSDALLHVVTNIGGLVSSQLGTWERDSRDVHRYMGVQMNLKDFIDEATLMSGDRVFYFDKSGKANLVSEDQWAGSLGTATFDDKSILSFNYLRDHEQLYNKINHYSWWSEPLQVYTTNLRQNSNRSQRETGLAREATIRDKWHYITTVPFSSLKSADTADMRLRQFQDASYKVSIEVPMALAARLDLRDRINVTYAKAPFGGTGGWIERNMRVIGLEQDYVNKRTIIDAWSHGHPFDVLGESADVYSHWWKLGDGTAQLYDDFGCKENFRITTAGTNYAWGTASDGSNLLFDTGNAYLGADFGYDYWGGNYQGIVSRKSSYQVAAFVKPLSLGKDNVEFGQG